MEVKKHKGFTRCGDDIICARVKGALTGAREAAKRLSKHRAGIRIHTLRNKKEGTYEVELWQDGELRGSLVRDGGGWYDSKRTIAQALKDLETKIARMQK